MPTYYFNIHGAFGQPDQDGQELPDDASAWDEATIFAGEFFKDVSGKLRPGQDWSVEVADENRKPLYTIYISARQME